MTASRNMNPPSVRKWCLNRERLKLGCAGVSGWCLGSVMKCVIPISSEIPENVKFEYKSPLSQAPDISLRDEAEQSRVSRQKGDRQAWSLNGGKLQQQEGST